MGNPSTNLCFTEVVTQTTCRGFRQCFSYDTRGEKLGLGKALIRWFVSTKYRAVAGFRLSQYFHRKKHKLLSLLVEQWVEKSCGIEIHNLAQIGPGLKLAHANGVIIGAGVVIEENVTIYQQVTLGGRKTEVHGEIKGRYPYIESGAVLYAGAKILGAVRIGNKASIGANAVVLQDVPAGAIAVGVPARIILPKDDIHE